MKNSVALALLIATALVGCNKPAANAPVAPVASAAGSASGVTLAYRDTAVAPGDNFDEFANGGWRKTAQIPPDRNSIGVSFEVFEKAENRTRELIQGIAKTKPAAGSDEARIADAYTAYMDTDGIEKAGLTPVKPILDQVAALNSKSALSKALGAGIRADTDPLNATNLETENLFGVFVSQTDDDATRYTAYLMQGGLGLPDRDYYLSAKPEMAKLRDGYRAYLVKVFTLLGRADAQAAADRVFTLENKIARVHASVEDSQDIHKSQSWKIDEFAKKAPGMDWPAFFDGAHLAGQPRLIAWQPGAIAGISKLVASEPLDAWKDWLVLHSVSPYAGVLPKAFDDARFAFYGTQLSGTPQQLPREKRALAYTSNVLGDAVGKIYAQNYFPAEAKADVQAMVKNILAAFDARVAALDWMADSTKAEARKKIATLRVGVGYPETWRDYSSVAIKSDDAFGNTWRAGEGEYRHQLAKLGKSVDRGEWWMTPQTVNAVNLPLQNALNFPAAILEAPYYDPKADAAANYGAIGSVIGHEISHSFDSLGAEFDAEGRSRNWWTPQDKARFQAAGQALVKQYDAYEPLPGLHLKGKQTLGENIADVAGLAAALDAYHASLGGKPAPVIDGLTGDQRFFLAFAQGWRAKQREELLRQRIATDGHAPAAYRVATVRNLDAWYGAYDVKPGQKLYLEPKDRVRVW